jgi:hypothetical protein
MGDEILTIREVPGLRSVLGHIQRMTSLDPTERHRLENAALDRRHARERLEIERKERFQARIEKREALSREKALRREQRLAQEARLVKDLSCEALAKQERMAEQARTVDNRAMQDFYDAAKDDGLWKHREFEDGELSESFNDAAHIGQDGDFSDDDGENYAPDWAVDHDDDGDDDDDGPKFNRNRRAGYGYRGESD